MHISIIGKGGSEIKLRQEWGLKNKVRVENFVRPLIIFNAIDLRGDQGSPLKKIYWRGVGVQA